MDESNTPVTIQQSWLLWVYVIVPILIGVVAADQLFFAGTWQPYLTTSALYFPLYILFFELPHIVASAASFADREYVVSYKRQLFYILPLVIGFFVIAFFVSFTLGVLLYALYTMYHFVRQQTGIGLTLTRRRDVWHEVWTYSGVLASFLGFLIVFAGQYISFIFVSFAAIALVPFSLLFVIISMYMTYRSPTSRARWYVSLVSLSIVASYVFLLLGYLFLTLFVLRFIHDVTAFIFYLAHDQARNRTVTHNVIYRMFKTFGIPVLLATPLFAVVVAYIMRSELMVFQTGVVIVMLIGVTHYYLESVMWKREAIHRAQLRFE